MVQVDVYVPAKVLAGTASFHATVTVWLPIPVFAAALKSFVAVGAVTAAGSVYGYATELVAVVHVTLASHATPGVDVTVVAAVESVCPPDVKVVDVAVMFQPAPDPVASPTSKPWFEVTVWSVPFSVAENEMLPGVLTNASDPALSVAVAVAADAGVATPARTNDAMTAAPIAARRRVFSDAFIGAFVGTGRVGIEVRGY
jgi:hypothetical protein